MGGKLERRFEIVPLAQHLGQAEKLEARRGHRRDARRHHPRVGPSVGLLRGAETPAGHLHLALVVQQARRQHRPIVDLEIDDRRVRQSFGFGQPPGGPRCFSRHRVRHQA
jgi:hypothetical protein